MVVGMFFSYMKQCVHYLGLPAGGLDRHAAYYWFLVMAVTQEMSSFGGCAALNVECKCWKLSCEHIAFSVM